LPPLDLYARVRFLCIRAHETAGAARIRLSLRPLVLFRGWQSTQNSGASRREIGNLRLQ
jgi:hypothetical protein